jgi:hypothetical protein
MNRMTTATRAVTTWAKKAREARERRDEAIRLMSAEGASLRQIAASAKMSHNGIVKILKGGDDSAHD